jgi:hypothetical protein
LFRNPGQLNYLRTSGDRKRWQQKGAIKTHKRARQEKLNRIRREEEIDWE